MTGKLGLKSEPQAVVGINYYTPTPYGLYLHIPILMVLSTGSTTDGLKKPGTASMNQEEP